MGCWGDLSNSILRPEILHGTLYMPKEWENEAWYLIFTKTIFLTHPNLPLPLSTNSILGKNLTNSDLAQTFRVTSGQ